MTPPARVIRAGVADDLDAVRRIARAAFAPFEAEIGRPPAPMVADYAALLADGRLLVVVGPSGVVGFAERRPEDDALHLETVAVAPAAQGCGHGRALINAVEAEAAALGCAAVTLETNIAMRANRALYPRLGYQETGRALVSGYRRVQFRKSLR